MPSETSCSINRSLFIYANTSLFIYTQVSFHTNLRTRATGISFHIYIHPSHFTFVYRLHICLQMSFLWPTYRSVFIQTCMNGATGMPWANSCSACLMNSLSTCVCDMTHSHAPWLIHMHHDSFTCGMTHSRVAWLIHMCHDSFMCGVTHSYMACLIHMCHDSFMCGVTHSNVAWLIHMCHNPSMCQAAVRLQRERHGKCIDK